MTSGMDNTHRRNQTTQYARSHPHTDAYFDKYPFEHDVLAKAVDKGATVAFFWLGKNVTPKDESVFDDDKVTPKDVLPSHTLGIFKHEFGSDGKIKDTWFLTPVLLNRSCSQGEGECSHLQRQWRYAPSEERSQKKDRAAHAYAEISSTGDPSAADAAMAEDLRFVDLLYEQETNSREEFKKMVHSVFKVILFSTSQVRSPSQICILHWSKAASAAAGSSGMVWDKPQAFALHNYVVSLLELQGCNQSMWEDVAAKSDLWGSCKPTASELKQVYDQMEIFSPGSGPVRRASPPGVYTLLEPQARFVRGAATHKPNPFREPQSLPSTPSTPTHQHHGCWTGSPLSAATSSAIAMPVQQAHNPTGGQMVAAQKLVQEQRPQLWPLTGGALVATAGLMGTGEGRATSGAPTKEEFLQYGVENRVTAAPWLRASAPAEMALSKTSPIRSVPEITQRKTDAPTLAFY
ncbi:TPA: hypothetical protein ACH3X1_014516 [Trebouxia sp. C0004]